MQPAVEIDVDEASGIWRTDGLPMLYVPRHFMVNMHNEIEQALGRDGFSDVLHRSGRKSALHWCRKQAEQSGASASEVFEFYLRRLSERGWGRFSIDRLDLAELVAVIDLRDSIYVLEAGGGAQAPTCYIFEGFFVGAMEYVCETLGISPQTISCRETRCAATGDPHCRFEVTCTLS